MSGHTLDIFYGADGRPFALKYDNTVYYYILSIQGDVLGLADASGNVVVKYKYDAWGKPGTSTIATGYGDLAYFNPLRYRGYVYDEESELYYLESRYYDAETGRFISADALLVAGDHINSTNMFAYCLNNPVMYVDPRGYAYKRNIKSDLGILIADIIAEFLLDYSGVPEEDQTYLYKNAYNTGDYLYLAIVIYKGKQKLHWDIGVCNSFKDKRICSIVAEYYTWVDGAGSKERVAKEIYAHTFIYYATTKDINSIKKAITYLPDNYELLAYFLVTYLYVKSDPITIGHETGADRAMRSALYEITWGLNLNG